PRPSDRAQPAAATALVVDDHVAQVERAHAVANGSTGQASARPSAGASSGTSTRQGSFAKAHRGWNAQPGGMLPGFGGEPAIATSGWCRRSSGCGSASSSARVYGGRGRRRTAPRGPHPPTPPPQKIQHPPPLPPTTPTPPG